MIDVLRVIYALHAVCNDESDIYDACDVNINVTYALYVLHSVVYLPHIHIHMGYHILHSHSHNTQIAMMLQVLV